MMGRFLRSSACALTTIGFAAALDLAGAGESPGILPTTWWFGWYNDYLGNARPSRADDFRTNRFVAGWRSADWTFAVDWSNLTAKNPYERYPLFGFPDPFSEIRKDGRRCDELTLSATYTWWESDSAFIAAGPGLRVAGDLGGAWLQAHVHQDTGSSKIILPYEDGIEPLAGLAVLRAGWRWPVNSSWTVVCDGAGIASTIGEFQGDLAARLAWRGTGGASWIGWRQSLRCGDTASAVARTVAEHERGGWLVAGLESPAVVFSLGAHPRTNAVEGSIQVRDLDRRAAPGVSLLPAEVELGVAAQGALADAGNGFDLRMAWGCPAMAGWWRDTLRATITGRRIERSLPSPWDLAGRTYQVIGGVQLSAWPTAPVGWTTVPYLAAGAGWHHAQVESISPAHYTDGGELDTLVGEYEAGVRAKWMSPSWASGAAVAINHQMFFTDKTVQWVSVTDNGTLSLTNPGNSIMLRWWVGITW
ncbi:MAG: hypothetical protein AAB263_10930 [Planctomycetota bacterium]